MRYLVQGGEDAETVYLLLSLTRIDSDDVKSALCDYLVRGLSDAATCALHQIAQSNFNRALNRLDQVAATVERLIEKRVRHLKSVK
jgi:hypothetical protein